MQHFWRIGAVATAVAILSATICLRLGRPALVALAFAFWAACMLDLTARLAVA